jgi:transcriptional regulator with XRE-family HTH domain
MIISDRLRAVREAKSLSQGDIEERTGWLRCYISRVENGHTVPAIETLEKMARALEVPLYQLFYDGEEPPELPNLPKRRTAADIAWGVRGRTRAFYSGFAAFSAALIKGTGTYCYSWPREWGSTRTPTISFCIGFSLKSANHLSSTAPLTPSHRA